MPAPTSSSSTRRRTATARGTASCCAQGETVAIVRDLPWLGSDARHWDEAAAVAGRILLAGGLGPENVRDAIEAVHPWAVDASRSLERSPGIKDHAKVRAFVEAARPEAVRA